MFIDSGFGEIYEAIIEVNLGNEVIQRQYLNAPEQILKMQFVGLMQEIVNENRPMSCKLIIKDVIWDEYEKKQKVLDNYVEFKNKLMEG